MFPQGERDPERSAFVILSAALVILSAALVILSAALVILSAAKDLVMHHQRFFAAFRMTLTPWLRSQSQLHFTEQRNCHGNNPVGNFAVRNYNCILTMLAPSMISTIVIFGHLAMTS